MSYSGGETPTLRDRYTELHFAAATFVMQEGGLDRPGCEERFAMAVSAWESEPDERRRLLRNAVVFRDLLGGGSIALDTHDCQRGETRTATRAVLKGMVIHTVPEGLFSSEGLLVVRAGVALRNRPVAFVPIRAEFGPEANDIIAVTGVYGVATIVGIGSSVALTVGSLDVVGPRAV